MESLAHYKLGDRVGSDRLADVYRAKDSALGRTVTVRVLRPEIVTDAARLEAVLASARAVLPLSHPNISALFQVGEEAGRHFLVFEYTPGDTLRGTVAGNPLNLRRALDLGAQIADALAEAHAQGLVHGALYPDSILITQKGRVKVLGFGAPPSPAGASIGSDPSLTPDDVECMAPERVLGARGDARADIFSLGCVLFEMLTGRQPFAAATASDTAVAVLSRSAPPPSQSNARVPPALDRLVERCLAKSVDTRPESAAAIAAELRQVAAEVEAEESGDLPAAMLDPSSRRRSTWPILVIILVLAAAAVAVFLLLK